MLDAWLTRSRLLSDNFCIACHSPEIRKDSSFYDVRGAPGCIGDFRANWARAAIVCDHSWHSIAPRGANMLTFLQDLRYSLRQLIKDPGFALTAILSLALGIGATVSVFSVIYGVLMHPFPYANVDRLDSVSITDPYGNFFNAWLTGPQLRELEQAHTVEHTAAWNEWDLTLTG